MGRVQSSRIGLSRCSVRSCHQGSLPGVAMLAEKELATVGRMADGRLFVSRVDLLHAYVHAQAIARQVKEYLGGTTNSGTAD
jgi:hypothetical protein